MNKKTGTGGTPVAPISPEDPKEADKADPGEVDQVKVAEIAHKKGKYGAVEAVPFKPVPTASPSSRAASSSSSAEESKDEEQKHRSWIEIELLGEDDKPIPGEKYRITLPDGTVDEGTLDQNGWARLENFDSGACKVSFPGLDEEAWKYLEPAGPRSPAK